MVNALSEWLEVTVTRNEQHHKLRFTRGKPEGPMAIEPVQLNGALNGATAPANGAAEAETATAGKVEAAGEEADGPLGFRNFRNFTPQI